ncbi:M-phase phosphoprotein 8 [Entomophthora muscae]|uniref:M-phase phosphoprotein 8 n=1 Tax=Entomophthora muscae TaxID=34485 RepID=A0ACC2RLR0_9FUNG|nr:M-phase phosphoprotein 8 [Entomophthora muscae]
MGTCSPTYGSRQPPHPSRQAASRNMKTHYQKPQYYVKWKGYPLEESTWELLRNLANAQEAIQLYLNNKNLKGGLLGEERDGVRIDNSFPLGTQGQEWDSNPDPDPPRAAGPMDQEAAYPHFLETEPPQAEASTKFQSQNTRTSWAMVLPKEELLKLPNGGRESSSVNFIYLKSSWVTNQIQSPKEKTGFRPNPMTTAQNKENQVTNLDFPTNERTPS